MQIGQGAGIVSITNHGLQHLQYYWLLLNYRPIASEHWSPSNVACTNGWDDGEAKPAVEWTHASAWQIYSTDFDPLSSAKCCKYRATSRGLVGMGMSMCEVAQTFHRLKAPKYFLVVLFAWLWRMVVGSLLTSFLNSGSFSSLSSIQLSYPGKAHLQDTWGQPATLTMMGNSKPDWDLAP